MAKQENASAVASAAEKTSSSEVAKKEQSFPVSTLRDNCIKLFGCTTSTFDGAFLVVLIGSIVLRKQKECSKNG